MCITIGEENSGYKFGDALSIDWRIGGFLYWHRKESECTHKAMYNGTGHPVHSQWGHMVESRVL